jgi:dipeptidyl aminopeptidase/acylaminoacyl peptidase
LPAPRLWAADIVGGVEYLLIRPDVEGHRMGIWGGSYGGRMASLGMATAPKYLCS